MNRIFLTMIIVFLCAGGCAQGPTDTQVLANVGDYKITKDEFMQAYRNSIFSKNDTLQSREDFLDILINQKLILQDAQKKGLDKNPTFLKSVERFWEQSLLKVALDKRTQEVAGSLSVSDREVEQFYERLSAEGKSDKPLGSVYHQLKWELMQKKEAEAVNSWVETLRSQSHIIVDQNLLQSN